MADPIEHEKLKLLDRITHKKWRDRAKRDPEKYDKILQKERSSAMRQRTKPDYYKKQTEWVSQKLKTDKDYKLLHSLRNKILRYIRASIKSTRTLDFLGCSIQDFKRHIESQFEAGMTWENHSLHGWHIDHKIPCASFDFTDPEQQRKCFHYSNMRPLWAIDNKRKSSIVDGILIRRAHKQR